MTPMQLGTALKAAGYSHPGLQRPYNEDRYHYDAARGLLLVVDGVGGQAAGEKAAETALATVRARLERATGAVEERVREAIALANNEIHRLASIQPEWRGMACVLTVAVAVNGEVVVGHVGDTRLYKLRGGRIEKLTRDHSPVGEREDAGELSEREAMQHPRRNEVYRDVGSEPHEPHDLNFIDVFRHPFEADAALLLCSDGLTDGVPSAAIAEIVRSYAGHPYEIARALVEAANEAGGKDNVTVVYAEGPRFAMGEDTRDLRLNRAPERPVPGTAPVRVEAPAVPSPLAAVPPSRGRAWLHAAIVLLLLAVAGVSAYLQWDRLGLPDISTWTGPLSPGPVLPAAPSVVRVKAGESIGAALAAAAPGSLIVVEPGEYREQLHLKPDVHVVSRVPRGAALRLPGGASETDAAVVAADVRNAVLSGFRIVGDAATPLGAGVIVRNSDLTLSDVEITGARAVAIEYSGSSGGAVTAAEVHDNPGAGIVVRAGAAPRIAHNRFGRNATARGAAGTLFAEADARPTVIGNIFVGLRPDGLAVPPSLAPAIARDNVFLAPAPAVPARQGRGRR